MKNKKGFTLVELLAVVIILGIMSSIAVIAVIKVKHMQDIENMGNMINGILTGAKKYESDQYNFNNTSGVEVEYLIQKGYVDIDEYKHIKSTDTIKYDMCENSIKRYFYISFGGNKFTDCGCDEQVADEKSYKICIPDDEWDSIRSADSGADYKTELNNKLESLLERN